MSVKKRSLAVIGCGRIAKAHLAAIAEKGDRLLFKITKKQLAPLCSPLKVMSP
jgi:hypothetical protein